MEQVKLTKEDVEKAETYLPLALKSAAAIVLAPGCIEKTESQPPRWQENVVGRKLAETYALAGYYLRLVDTSGLDQPVPKFEFTLDQYDSMALLREELENFGEDKGDLLLKDYDRFLDILDREIKNQLTLLNDPILRFGAALSMQMTPEAFQTLQKELEQAKGGEGV